MLLEILALFEFKILPITLNLLSIGKREEMIFLLLSFLELSFGKLLVYLLLVAVVLHEVLLYHFLHSLLFIFISF